NISSGVQTLGASNPPPKPVTSTPKPAVAATYSPTPKGGRTLGATPSAVNSDPRTAVAMAAENTQGRNQPKQAKGRLGKQLDAQRAQTHNETRIEASREALLARNADANAQARAYN
ncbi:hypothetical protein E4T44_11263, partial [Aureobasidium sp. EXF-8845]